MSNTLILNLPMNSSSHPNSQEISLPLGMTESSIDIGQWTIGHIDFENHSQS